MGAPAGLLNNRLRQRKPTVVHGKSWHQTMDRLTRLCFRRNRLKTGSTWVNQGAIMCHVHDVPRPRPSPPACLREARRGRDPHRGLGRWIDSWCIRIGVSLRVQDPSERKMDLKPLGPDLPTLVHQLVVPKFPPGDACVTAQFLPRSSVQRFSGRPAGTRTSILAAFASGVSVYMEGRCTRANAELA